MSEGVEKSSRRFAVFDIDGTVIRWQLYHAIADELVKLGFVEPQAYASTKDARMAWKKRQEGASFKSYEDELVRVYQQVLLGLTTDQFEQAADTVFSEYQDQVYTYTRDLIAYRKSKGYLLFAISGSQSEIVEKIAGRYGFDDFLASDYKREGNKFTGEVTHYLGRKDQAIKELVKKHAATWAGSIAVGDSMSDKAMLEIVENPIAFNPEQALFDHAKQQGWKIVVERKNVVYELEENDGTYLLA